MLKIIVNQCDFEINIPVIKITDIEEGKIIKERAEQRNTSYNSRFLQATGWRSIRRNYQ